MSFETPVFRHQPQKRRIKTFAGAQKAKGSISRVTSGETLDGPNSEITELTRSERLKILRSSAKLSKPGRVRKKTKQLENEALSCDDGKNTLRNTEVNQKLNNKVETELVERESLPQLAAQAPSSNSEASLEEFEHILGKVKKRRRRTLFYFWLRMFFFVVFPTLFSWIYFYHFATPSYLTKSQFVVQRAESPSAPTNVFAGTPVSANQDSIMVQDLLKSREALAALDRGHEYREHFSSPYIDSWQRLPKTVTKEELFQHYSNNVTIGYDPTEGVIRMEIFAFSPEKSLAFSTALIQMAEERVDRMTERMRTAQLRGASDSFVEAESGMLEAQLRVLNLQEQLGVLDPRAEASALMSQISVFETQLAEKSLHLKQLFDNPQPNQARLVGVKGDIERLNQLIDSMRKQMTQKNQDNGSLASIASQIRLAEIEFETRTLLMQEAMQTQEAARLEASRQVRYLSVGVTPIAPDEPTHPKVFENTLITFLTFSSLYLLLSLTLAVLRDQISG